MVLPTTGFAIVCVSGITVNASGAPITVTTIDPDLPPTDAVMVAEMFVVVIGAVNIAVATPFVVEANGTTVPDVVVKFTTVLSGTGFPAVVVTVADMLDVPAEATVDGFAATVTVFTVTGCKNSVKTLKAPLSADAVILTVLFVVRRISGETLASTEACPALFV